MSDTDTSHEVPRETIHAHLKQTLEHLTAAGHSAHELVMLSIEELGHNIVPILRQFQDEVRSGKIKIENITESAKTALFGIHVSPQQREHMIRDAAYSLAAKRGFVGGSPQEDWLEAEGEIDQFLAVQAGIIAKGRQAAEAVTAITEERLSRLSDKVDRWVKSRGGAKTYH